MPTYEYLCDNGHKTEVRAGYEVIAVTCPTCGQEARRVPIYECQYINGETVAKGVGGNR